jgi:hypothetical protein
MSAPNVREGKIHAPFTAEQQAALAAYQRSGLMHPFTCPDHSDRALVPGPFWYCPENGCNYTQRWAHEFMASPRWWAAS